MTKRQTANIGVVLLIVGGLSLLANLGIVGDSSDVVGSLFLGAVGAGFVSVYLRQSKHLWSLLVGFAFMGAAAATLTGALAGSYFLGFIGAGFALTYIRHPKHWWAVIPAGVLFTLSLVAGVTELLPALDPGFLFFAGISATFGYLYTLPQGGKRWAIYPALATLILAVLSSSFTGGWLLPLLLIGGGVYILRQKTSTPKNTPEKGAPASEGEPETEDVESSFAFLERPSWEEVVEDLKEPSAS